MRQQPRVLSAEERAAIRQLAVDIPALWQAPTTTAADRKEIIRQVIERVVVDAQGASERVRVRIQWLGGGHTDGAVIRPVARLADLSYYPELCERVRTLASEGLATATIADRLEAEGYRPARTGSRFGRQGIVELQRRLGIRVRRARTPRRAGLGLNEWWPVEITRQLDLPRATLHYWIRRGWVRARREEQPPGRWIVWADAAELERLRDWRRRSVADEARRRWANPPAELPTADPADEETRREKTEGSEQCHSSITT